MLACREQRSAQCGSGEGCSQGGISGAPLASAASDFDLELCAALAALLWNIADARLKYSMHASRGAKDISRRVILALPRELLPLLPKDAQDAEISVDPDPPIPPKPAQSATPGADAPSADSASAAPAAGQPQAEAPQAPGGPPSSAAPSAPWTCPACTTVNQPSYVICAACFSDKPSDAPSPPHAVSSAAAAAAAASGGGSSQDVTTCTAMVPGGPSVAPPPSLVHPDTTPPDPPPDTLGLMLTWSCAACTSENPPGTTVCSVCLSSRSIESSGGAPPSYPPGPGDASLGGSAGVDADAALAAALSASLNADLDTGAAVSAAIGASGQAGSGQVYADFDFASVAPPPGREVQDPYWGVEGGVASTLAVLCITEESTLLGALAAMVQPVFRAPSVHGAMTVAHRAAEGSISRGMLATAQAMFGQQLAGVLTHGDVQAADAACTSALAAGELSAHSGVALLVYAAVLTRGVPNCREDTSRDRMFSTLVYADGTSEQALLNLLLCGMARNDVDDATWCDVTLRPPVGFLSAADGITVCNMWKRPAHSVWVTHAGNHYTVLASSVPGLTGVSDTRSAAQQTNRSTGVSQAASQCDGSAGAAVAEAGGAKEDPPQDSAPVFQVEHFNGLHPPSAGNLATRHAMFRVAVWGDWGAAGIEGGSSDEGAAVSAEAAAAAKTAAEELHVKKILTVRVVPGGSKDSGPWEFLVVCKAKGRLEGALLTGGEDGGPITAPPYPGRWYCRDCMLPKAPNYAGYNLEGVSVCSGCGKHISECGHAHWVQEREMPVARVKEWKRGNAAQVTQVLRTRWPALDADWALCGGVAPSMFG